MTTRLHIFSTAMSVVLMAGALCAQVTLKRGAVVYHGSAANTTAPATIDEKKVRAVTVEWQEIESEGIDLQTARGKQLVQKMNKRIREAVKAVAGEESRDLVVRAQDIADSQGHDVVDLTEQVASRIEADQ